MYLTYIYFLANILKITVLCLFQDKCTDMTPIFCFHMVNYSYEECIQYKTIEDDNLVRVGIKLVAKEYHINTEKICCARWL